MKLLTYDAGRGPRAGVLVDDDQVVDASRVLQARAPLRDVQALLESSESAVDRLQEAIGRGQHTGVPLASVRLKAPLL